MGVGAPQVSYREAITAPAEIDYTHKKQSGGSGQYARVKIQFEPKEFSEEEGAMDFEFASDIKGGSVPKEYIPGVVKGVQSVLGAGLVDGAYHDVDSSVMAFEIAGGKAGGVDSESWLTITAPTGSTSMSYFYSYPNALDRGDDFHVYLNGALVATYENGSGATCASECVNLLAGDMVQFK